MNNKATFWENNKTLILFLVSLTAIFGIVYYFRMTLLPFIAGLIIAYLLLPLIKWAECKIPCREERVGVRRLCIISVVYIMFFIIVGLFVALLYFGVKDSFSVFLSDAPTYISNAFDNVQKWLESIRNVVPAQYQPQVNSIIDNASTKLGEGLQSAFSSGFSIVSGTIGVIAGFISLPFFLFFVLKDSKSLSEGFYAFVPDSVENHVRDIIKILDNVIGKYIRAQVILGLVMGGLILIGLLAFGIKLAPVLAVFAGIMEVVPVIGPWMSAILGCLVVLAVAPDKIIYVVIMYGVANLLENLVLTPRINGGFLKINPAVLMVALTLGATLAGVWGMIIAGPLVALSAELYKYVRANLSYGEEV